MKSKKGTRKDLSRRDFIKTTAVGIGATALTGLGSTEVKAVPPPLKWDKEADIVIVGAGYAGMCAAIEAAEAGSSVIVVEKNSYVGGNSILCAGNTQLAGTHVQARNNVEDHPEWWYEDIMAFGEHRAIPELVRTAVEKGPELALWLEGLGLKWRDTFSQNPDCRVPRGHSPAPNPSVYPGSRGNAIFLVQYKRALELGVTILLNHQLTRIVRQMQTGGRVVGIQVAVRNAGIQHIRARQAVILASGGWKANVQMRMAWDSRLDADLYAGGLPYVETTGEGIMAAVGAGAGLINMSYVCEFRVRWGTKLYQTWKAGDLNSVPGGGGVGIGNTQRVIIVANDGQRFSNENILAAEPYNEFWEDYLNLEKRPRNVWAIADADGAASLGWSKAEFDAPNPDTGRMLWPGFVATADSLAELAQKIGVSASGLEATVQTYNANLEGEDPFGRPTPRYALTKPPFFAAKGQFFCHDQMGGIRINTKAQVLDREFQLVGPGVRVDEEPVIPGFYAAGECSAGFVGAERGHGKIGIYMIFGRIAGQNAAKEPRV